MIGFFSLHLLLCELIHLCSVGKLLLFVVNILTLDVVIKNEWFFFSIGAVSIHAFICAQPVSYIHIWLNSNTRYVIKNEFLLFSSFAAV